jgi:hypothetical protein
MPILVRWTTIYPESLSIANRLKATSGHKLPRRAAYKAQYAVALNHVLQKASTTKRIRDTPDAQGGQPAANCIPPPAPPLHRLASSAAAYGGVGGKLKCMRLESP